jgi:TRAP transporter TAXI family solute receptor
MRKSVSKALLLLLTGFFIFTQSAIAAPDNYKWPEVLKIQSLASMGPFYQTIAAWGPLLERETGMKVRATPQDNPVVAAKNLKDRKFDINCTDVDMVALAQKGMESFALKDLGPFAMRTIWGFESTYRGILVRGDSELNSIDDFKKGTAISVPPGVHPLVDVYAMAAWTGLNRDDLKIVTIGSGPGSTRAVVEGKSDGAAAMATDPLIYELEANPYGVKWLPLDAKKNPEAAARWLDVKPLSSFGIPPKEMKIAPSAKGVSMWATHRMFTGTTDLDADLVYHLVKWLNENVDNFKAKHDSAYAYSADLFREQLDTTVVPIHEGTIRYLKELGLWTAADDKRQAYNVALFDQYIAAFNAALAQANEEKIKVVPDNEQWMALWEEHKAALPDFKVILNF